MPLEVERYGQSNHALSHEAARRLGRVAGPVPAIVVVTAMVGTRRELETHGVMVLRGTGRHRDVMPGAAHDEDHEQHQDTQLCCQSSQHLGSVSVDRVSPSPKF